MAKSITNNNLLYLIEKAGENHDIPKQGKVAYRITGTNADAFAFSNGGVPSVLISLSQRYMHTTEKMMHQEDVENIIRLIYQSLQNIENNHDFYYWK
jgi:putative aminopeptidase FrvX